MSENKMTPTPWQVLDYGGYGVLHKADDCYYGSNDLLDAEDVGLETAECNRAAIISAINGTYGIGIDPNAVKDLLEALEFCQSVIRSQGMFDLSERMADDKAMAAIEKAKLTP